MGTPIQTKNGTAFAVKPGGTTEVLRQDQPACEVPTDDLLEFAQTLLSRRGSDG
ncbi:hypothetical protein [Kerstersia gyiorum]|uniref:hypothetical protein n=1 Tax=Kerstersia gyiorum TaxID=206506 RepID=UPI0020A04C18|nr:hypothetical protein [Kerstersia gyiorum]MCP1679441.1 hypothetical protein [Kerstersia gyiorum]MCP1823944.1 hypothetical protein [Kerstersia gyiorum]MCP1827385.1 hypothetical protein [Kerstersia gyiorum]MCW2448966.1 hypothetical protein [Kerstersia gyiorum]